MFVDITTFENAEKVFSTVQFQGNNFLKKKHFSKIRENGRNILKFLGRAAVVVTKTTPIIFDC